MAVQYTSPTALVVFNPLAGKGDSKAHAVKVKMHLELHGWVVVDLIATEYAGHLETVLAQQWGTRVELIVVVGGDGTLRELVSGLRSANLHVEIGFIPLGNANVVARELDIPLQPELAIEKITSGIAAKVDIGILQQEKKNDVVFLAMLEIGYGAKIVHLVDKLRNSTLKGLYHFWGDLVYVLASVIALKGLNQGVFTVILDGKTLNFPITHGVVANMQTYAKGWSMTPAALHDDGLFETAMRRRNGIWSIIRTFIAASQKKKLQPTFMDYQQAKHVTISSAERLFAQIDGDPLYLTGKINIITEKGAFSIRV